MTTNKHTPGPWMPQLCVYGERPAGLTDRDANLEPIVDDVGCILEADAILMAAAPDMLLLLEELISIEGPQPGHAEWANRVKATIKKARGE